MEIENINQVLNFHQTESVDNNLKINNTDWDTLWNIKNIKPSFADFLTPHAPCNNATYSNYGIECDANGLPATEEGKVKGTLLDGLPMWMFNTVGQALDMVNEIEEK